MFQPRTSSYTARRGYHCATSKIVDPSIVSMPIRFRFGPKGKVQETESSWRPLGGSGCARSIRITVLLTEYGSGAAARAARPLAGATAGSPTQTSRIPPSVGVPGLSAAPRLPGP